MIEYIYYIIIVQSVEGGMVIHFIIFSCTSSFYKIIKFGID